MGLIFRETPASFGINTKIACSSIITATYIEFVFSSFRLLVARIPV